MGNTVYLSPSTQEHNIGAGNYGTEEIRMNQIADVVERDLKLAGITVYRNRPEMTLQQAVADSNKYYKDCGKKDFIHVPVHSNAANGKARGCEVIALQPGYNGEKLAKSIYKRLEPLTPTADRGVKFSKTLYELNTTDAPAAITEIAFHDNPEDAAWILANIETIGHAIADGVLDFFRMERATAPKTPIPGVETVTLAQCRQYLLRHNPEAPDVLSYYEKHGNVLGIRWGYAVAQMMKETGFLKYGGDVKPEQNNFAGIGAVGNGAKGATFVTPEKGVLAQLQHLYAYASTQPLPNGMKKVDPHFDLVVRGGCPNWEDLNGRWAVPGVGYGEDIVRIHDEIACEVVKEQLDKVSQALDLLRQAIKILEG